jgi:SAM-dependent methyltransferase
LGIWFQFNTEWLNTSKEEAVLKYEDNPKSIKYYVKKYIQHNAPALKNKKVIDFPAGNGVTSRILKEAGAVPVPIDLFPEYFEVEGMECLRTNIKDGLPLDDHFADVLICQEGIEHFSDQFEALREFNRVLKPGGTLLITTPNYSNLQSKLSYLLAESERFNSIMAPNELDSIWISDQQISSEVYFGHIFLIGIQKLRVLAKLSGFNIRKFHFTRTRSTSAFLLPFFYPFIVLSNRIAYRKNMRKNKQYTHETRKEVYSEIYRLSVNPKILVCADLMIEFVKEQESASVIQGLKGKYTFDSMVT